MSSPIEITPSCNVRKWRTPRTNPTTLLSWVHVISDAAIPTCLTAMQQMLLLCWVQATQRVQKEVAQAIPALRSRS